MIPRYTLAEMGAIWTEDARFERMLRSSSRSPRRRRARGLIPGDALDAIGATPGSTSRASPSWSRPPTTT